MKYEFAFGGILGGICIAATRPVPAKRIEFLAKTEPYRRNRAYRIYSAASTL